MNSAKTGQLLGQPNLETRPVPFHDMLKATLLSCPKSL